MSLNNTSRPLVLLASIALSSCGGPEAGSDAQLTFVAPDRELAREADLEQIAQRVEIVRTTYGVPHITADDLEALAFGVAWVQSEDYGVDVYGGIVSQRGEWAWVFEERAQTEDDAWNLLGLRRAIETYETLPDDARAMLEGFAAGLNFYVLLHPDEFPGGMRADFTGVDVSAMTVGQPALGVGQRVRNALERAEMEGAELTATELDTDDTLRPFWQDDVGSNSWALAPSRTVNGNALLLRNPHLAWDAGYYEAHLSVPGVLEWYGDVRIGGAFAIIGGFNGRLGWSTTNNAPDREEVYRLQRDPAQPDSYLFDGTSMEVRQEVLEVPWQGALGRSGQDVHTFTWTHLGPVIHETSEEFFVVKAANDGVFRRPEQYLRMMQAQTLEEWQDAMRIHAIDASNYTYADADGNILLVWNARQPQLPLPPGPGAGVSVAQSDQVWSDVVPWDSLPKVLNPEGGYVQNSNDPPWLTNMQAPLDPEDFADNFPAPRLRLRSQSSLQLIGGDDQLTLEEMVLRKHSARMLLADRVLDDLLKASTQVDGLAEATRVLGAWDRAGNVDSRGAVLFQEWWQAYLAGLPRGAEPYAEPWSPDSPTETPMGLGHLDVATEALADAVSRVNDRWGSLDVPWGDVHRGRVGSHDVPLSGCAGSLGCFRVLSFQEDDDGLRRATSGDGWVMAMEFSDPPRAMSVLAYGQSNQDDSPYQGDQLEMFSQGQMKTVPLSSEEIEAAAVERYRPGGR